VVHRIIHDLRIRSRHRLEHAIANWTSADGINFAISKTSSSASPEIVDGDVADLSKVDRINTAGTSAAMWVFGGVHMKVKAWTPGLQSEHETIAHVRETFPNISEPEAVSFWVDIAWNRSFLVLKSIPGRTLHSS
jgi:hypothetical protein